VQPAAMQQLSAGGVRRTADPRSNECQRGRRREVPDSDLEHFPEKTCPHLMRGGDRFSARKCDFCPSG
jgi:hypothetical protein